MMDVDKLKNDYELFTSNLLDWIKIKILELNNRIFSSSLEDIQKELLKFKKYRAVEKPPK